MTKEVGTLAELNVKPGDVVEWPGIAKYLVLNGGDVVSKVSGIPLKNGIDYPGKRFRIVSRASETPKLWRYMTPEEKGALLLAHHEGNQIQYYSYFHLKWSPTTYPAWENDYAYRIKPEPKVETVNLYSNDCAYGRLIEAIRDHRITFNLIDGEPDCTSIKMEKL